MILDRFSALKMDRMPLYDYACKGIPLLRPIEKRQFTLELVEWKGGDHPYRWPRKALSDEKRGLGQSPSSVNPATVVSPIADDSSEGVNKVNREDKASNEVLTAFVWTMRVSRGMYVHSVLRNMLLLSYVIVTEGLF
jgi:tRNA pseudouridine55 synthase